MTATPVNLNPDTIPLRDTHYLSSTAPKVGVGTVQCNAKLGWARGNHSDVKSVGPDD